MSDTSRSDHAAQPTERLPFEALFELERIKACATLLEDDRRLVDRDAPGAVRAFRIRSISQDGTILPPAPKAVEQDQDQAVQAQAAGGQYDDSAQWFTDPPKGSLLRAGDFLVSNGFVTRPKVAIVRPEDLPAAATQQLTVLRPVNPVPADHARLICAFLRSGQVTARAVSVGSIMRVRHSDLTELTYPANDRPLSTALARLADAGDQLRAWGAEARALELSLFDRSEDTEAARREVIKAGQLTRLRALAAAQLDDPGFVIRTAYPYPVALRWREVEAQLSDRDHDKKYSAVLRAAETLLGYAGLVTVALAHEKEISCKAIKAFRSKIANGHGGPGYGDWARILQQIGTADGVEKLPPEHPLHEFAALLADDEAQQACDSLNAKRNAGAHHRTDPPRAAADKLEEGLVHLRLLIDRARFLADFPLIHVTDVSWDRHSGTDVLTLRRMMGDHPVVRNEELRYTGETRIASHCLYLADRDQGLHPLSPFLTAEICGTCGARSIFRPDKERGELLQTALEHGDSYPYAADEYALRAVGLRNE